MGEVLLGLFMLALGWMCLRHAFHHPREGYSRPNAQSSKRDEPEEKPLMWMPLVLGTLFIMTGVKQLAWVILELFRRHYTSLP